MRGPIPRYGTEAETRYEREIRDIDTLPRHGSPSEKNSDYTNEFTKGWKVLAGSLLGIAIGVISMPVAALSIFMPGLQHEFGWTRAEVSGAFTVLVLVLLVTSPFVGLICDRIRSRNVVFISQLGLAAAFFLFSRIGGNVTHFLIGFGVMALIGSGASTVAFARIISANFVHARGLALGIGMNGFGLTSLVMPLFLVPYVARHGWRDGFVILGVTTLVLAPLVYVLLSGNARVENRQPDAGLEAGGVDFAEAFRSRKYWVMAVAFTLTSLGISGLNVHFVSMMTDAGLSPARAGAIASAIGASTIGIRLATGLSTVSTRDMSPSACLPQQHAASWRSLPAKLDSRLPAQLPMAWHSGPSSTSSPS